MAMMSRTTHHTYPIGLQLVDHETGTILGEAEIEVAFDYRGGIPESGHPHMGTYDPVCGPEISHVHVGSVTLPDLTRIALAWCAQHEDDLMNRAQSDRDEEIKF